MKTNVLRLLVVALIVAITTVSFSKKEPANKTYEDPTFFTMNGDELKRPTDYRSWVYVGTPLTPNDMNNGKAAFPEFHNVYIDPVSYDYWKTKGKFRDGTIIIKELVSVGSKAAVSGNGYFMGEFIGLEATIKSSKHFASEPGNWAYFSFTNPNGGNVADNAKAFKTNQCNACHAASAADDFVFTQYYPVLASAKGVGKEAPENSSKR
ncbi:cytochrome P460 family protein [Aquimarina sp. 2201CG5-10]|uniref:cytochrome P460 family protein n=1 Tax=Aquimarina callyspongiae TaxID=3098150 RepID=UPI002AB3A414|nr:cytochrome P460 family protein [Aquimarina sp. 2201CG5-10]MDY8137066.1 cytochrome P460 family protein [Aquimarina sp. 2201CG5-10]